MSGPSFPHRAAVANTIDERVVVAHHCGVICACIRCESERLEVYGWSRHGVLSGGTLLLGLRRCADCGAEFSVWTGTDAGIYARRIRFVNFGALVLMIVFGVVYTLAT